MLGGDSKPNRAKLMNRDSMAPIASQWSCGEPCEAATLDLTHHTLE
jgi:hypothetical protein